MTEPGTGSDLKAMRTTAVRDGDEYVINGSKTFISNGLNADLIIVVCKTDPSAGAKGVSLIVVEADRRGLPPRPQARTRSASTPRTPPNCSSTTCACRSAICLGEEGKGFSLPDGRTAAGALHDRGLGRRAAGSVRWSTPSTT